MRCLIDMDGVICDFVGGLEQLYGRLPFEKRQYAWDLFGEFGLNEKKFWDEDSTIDWWANLDKTPEADYIVDTCTKIFGEDHICILTAPGDGDAMIRAIAGKQKWINKHYPQLRKQVLYGKPKQFCAGKGALLIDDSDANCQAFSRFGGWCHLLPRPWNSEWHLEPLHDFEYCMRCAYSLCQSELNKNSLKLQ